MGAGGGEGDKFLVKRGEVISAWEEGRIALKGGDVKI